MVKGGCTQSGRSTTIGQSSGSHSWEPIAVYSI
jgi:hypothetical protein